MHIDLTWTKVCFEKKKRNYLNGVIKISIIQNLFTMKRNLSKITN